MRRAILLLVLSVLLASCATTKTPLPTDNIDELVGTWVNTEYKVGLKAGKWVWKADGTAAIYQRSTHNRSYAESNWIVKEKWMAANGAIDLVVYSENVPDLSDGTTDERSYLIRLSSDRSYHEMMVFGEIPPVDADIDPNDPAYRIYYRQK